MFDMAQLVTAISFVASMSAQPIEGQRPTFRRIRNAKTWMCNGETCRLLAITDSPLAKIGIFLITRGRQATLVYTAPVIASEAHSFKCQ